MNKLFLLTLFVPGIVFAQNPGSEQVELSWQDCVREALANNPGLKAKKLLIDQYKYLLWAGYNAYLPSVNISHSVNRSGGTGTPASTRWNFSVSASEPIFNLKAISSIRTSRINYEKTMADYRNESAALRQSLYSSFVNLIVAQEQIRVDKRVLEIREQNAKLIRLKYESGMESRGNMMYSDALYELAKSDEQKASRSLIMSQRELLKNMGSAQYRPITVKAELKTPDYDLKPEEVKPALENIPQVISLKKGIAISREKLLSAKYDLIPTISANQSLGWADNTEFPSKRSWSAGLSLSMPLFANGITYYPNNVAASRLALKSAEESLRDLMISLENDIISAYNDLLNSRDTVIANIKIVSANEERYKESQINYMAGQISFIDLVNVEQSMVDTQQNHLQYLKNANNKKLALENLLGVGLED